MQEMIDSSFLEEYEDNNLISGHYYHEDRI